MQHDERDPYQERYEAHQKRKAEVLKQIVAERHSERQFGKGHIPDEAFQDLIESALSCPSSCDRKGVNIKVVDSRDEKALLGGILVGGVGWIHRADKIFLLFADPLAYKAPGEIDYMPYLDAGVIVEQLYLTAASYDLASCYANPNIREMNKPHFERVFGEGIFCGAFAVGNHV